MIVKDYKISISTGEIIDIIEISYEDWMDKETVDLCCRMPLNVLEDAKYGDDFQFRKFLSGDPERNLIRCQKILCTEHKVCVLEGPDCVPGRFRKSKSLLPMCFNVPDPLLFVCIHSWREGKYVIIPSP